MTDRLLVLVRHGQSDWNLKNLFTGWRDVDLTDKGVAEACEAGRKLKGQGIKFDVAFTSALIRAQRTLDLMLEELGQTKIPVFKDQALNERDYGDALVGQVDIAPAGEQVLQVPVALAVTHEHEKTVGHFTALSHLRNLSTPGHPSSNRAPASACAPTAPRATRRARRSCGPRPCAPARHARPGRRRSRCARRPRCRRATPQNRCRRPCARRCGRRGWRPYACRDRCRGLPPPRGRA